MRQRAKRPASLGAALALMALPVMAEEAANPELERGGQLLREGFGLLLEGLTAELAPMAEGWQKLVEQLGDLTAYHPPEFLPNGDIIIRRKSPLDPDGDGEVEL